MILNKSCPDIFISLDGCFKSLIGYMHFYDMTVCVWGCGVCVLKNYCVLRRFKFFIML